MRKTIKYILISIVALFAYILLSPTPETCDTSDTILMSYIAEEVIEGKANYKVHSIDSELTYKSGNVLKYLIKMQAENGLGAMETKHAIVEFTIVDCKSYITKIEVTK
jgi:hypothetical protein